MKTDEQAPISEQQQWADRIHKASQALEQPPAGAPAPKRKPTARDTRTGRFRKTA
jgi:hypothetical protein